MISRSGRQIGPSSMSVAPCPEFGMGFLQLAHAVCEALESRRSARISLLFERVAVNVITVKFP